MSLPSTCGECPRVIRAHYSHYCMRGVVPVIVASAYAPESDCPLRVEEGVESRGLGAAVSVIVDRDFERIGMVSRIAALESSLRTTREALVRAARCPHCLGRGRRASQVEGDRCRECLGTGYLREPDVAREAAKALKGGAA